MDLSKKTAFLWIVANTLRLAFGATEINPGTLTIEDIETVNRSIPVSQ